MNHQEYQRLLSRGSDERSKEEKPSPRHLNMRRKQRAKLGLELPSASFLPSVHCSCCSYSLWVCWRVGSVFY